MRWQSRLQLPTDAKVLVTNDGKIVGRTAAARRIIGQEGIDADFYSELLREAVFQARSKKFYSGEVIVGLDEEFTVKSHLMVPADYSPNLYSYLLAMRNTFSISNRTKSILEISSSLLTRTGSILIFLMVWW